MNGKNYRAQRPHDRRRKRDKPPRQRYSVAERLIEPIAHGKTPEEPQIRMHIYAIRPTYRDYERLVRDAARHNCRRTELTARRAPAWIINRYSDELRVMRTGVEIIRGVFRERLAAKAR